jgi:hypothetical protein
VTLLITLFNIKGIVHFEFIPQGDIVNQAYYAEILKQLHEVMRGQKPEFWPSDCIVHNNNAPAHKALSVKQFLTKKIDY